MYLKQHLFENLKLIFNSHIIFIFSIEQIDRIRIPNKKKLIFCYCPLKAKTWKDIRVYLLQVSKYSLTSHLFKFCKSLSPFFCYKSVMFRCPLSNSNRKVSFGSHVPSMKAKTPTSMGSYSILWGFANLSNFNTCLQFAACQQELGHG